MKIIQKILKFKLKEFLIKHYFRVEDEFIVMLGTKLQKGSMFAPVKAIDVWKRESLVKKFISIVSFKWKPTEEIVLEGSRSIFMYDIFGTKNDYGYKLREIILWHNSREWNLNDLTSKDIEKSEAIGSMTILTRLRYEQTSDFLRLNLYERAPFMCELAHPMIVKIPILSFQYYLNIQTDFSFNSIRKAKHPQADNLIDYMYDVLYLQQKTAIALQELLIKIDYTEINKGESLFINSEINAIMYADLIFSYLKATIEKVIIIVGLTYNIINLDSKKEHKKKISALKEGLPKELFDLFYFQLMFDQFTSENLDELNKYRSGLLHKKGIADLQPHNYFNKNVHLIPLWGIFDVLHEQHTKNTVSLIGALALLTDKLVELDFPDLGYEDLPPI